MEKEAIVGNAEFGGSGDISLLNVTVFSRDNNSQEIPLTSLDLHLASGYVLEENFASVSGFILEGHFYGTVFLKVTREIVYKYRLNLRHI